MDPSFERFVRLVRSTVGVPVALVTIVEAERQVFPGAAGLPEPWQSTRETPLTHSFCQYVVADRQPLIIADARLDPRVIDNLAITDLNVIAYAGFPLTTDSGRVVGALCAVDTEPREWTAQQLAAMADLAAACSAELALREARRRAEEAEDSARRASRHANGLLLLIEGLNAALDESEVAAAIQQGTVQALGVAYAGVWLEDKTSCTLRYVQHPTLSWPQAERRGVIGATESSPVVVAALQGRTLLFTSEVERVTDFPATASLDDEAPYAAMACIPLPFASGSRGALVLAWSAPRAFSGSDRSLFATLATYAAQALERAQLITHHQTTAAELQQALLTALPQPDHLELRVRYVPAATRDLVGGDWYDSFLLHDGATMIVIGDVVGHDITAAAKMGQIRNILRGLAWSRPDTPAALVSCLDQTLSGLSTEVLATLVAARIEQPLTDAATGDRTLRWTNAGHLPPILIDAAGTPSLLDTPSHDLLLGVSHQVTRTNHTITLDPGSTVLLYTDGLIERREESLDDSLRRLLEVIARHKDLELDVLLDVLLDELVADKPSDDIALMAVRFHPEDQPRPPEAGPRNC